MFITGLAARDKAPEFEELIGIFLQEEERQQNLRPQNDNLALVAKRRQFRGKQPQQQRQPQQQQRGGSTFQKRPFRGMSRNNFSDIKCFYCGKNGYQAKFFLRGRQMRLGISSESTRDILLMKVTITIFNCLQLIMLFQLLRRMRTTYGMLILAHPHI